MIRFPRCLDARQERGHGGEFKLCEASPEMKGVPERRVRWRGAGEVETDGLRGTEASKPEEKISSGLSRILRYSADDVEK